MVVLDRLSHPGMYKVVRLLADGSKDNEIWVPSTVLQRKKSTAEIIMPAGNAVMLEKYISMESKNNQPLSQTLSNACIRL